MRAVLDDWHTAPIDEKVRAMLGYLEKMTLHPDDLGPDDVALLYAAGLTQQAINEAMHVCFLFNVIDRIADALNFHVPASFTSKSARMLLKRGYHL
jgi:alkylhydroperoxidase family enzyme